MNECYVLMNNCYMFLYVHDLVSYYVNIFFMIKFIEMKYFAYLRMNEYLLFVFFIYLNVLSTISYIVYRMGNGELRMM